MKNSIKTLSRSKQLMLILKKRAYGTVKLTFQAPSTSQTPIVSHPPSEQSTPRNSFSYSSMITAVSTAKENLPIHGFASDGYPIY